MTEEILGSGAVEDFVNNHMVFGAGEVHASWLTPFGQMRVCRSITNRMYAPSITVLKVSSNWKR